MATMNKARATATRGQRNGRAPAGSSRPAGGGGCRRVCRLRRGGEEGDRPGGQRFGFEEVHFGRSREGVNALRKRRRRVESWRVAGSPSTNEPLWVKTRERRTLELRLGLALRLFQHHPPPQISHVGQPSPTQQTWLQATRWGHIRRVTKTGQARQTRGFMQPSSCVNSKDKQPDNASEDAR